MSSIQLPDRAFRCLYCGEVCSRGNQGEHIVPNALGGKRTLNDATDHIAVCQQCNNQSLSEVDKELAVRSYLAVLASRHINPLVWQAWDVNESEGELLDAIPEWSNSGELYSCSCRPQLIVSGRQIQFYCKYDDSPEFNVNEANDITLRAAIECFRRWANGEGKIHPERVHRDSVPPGYRYTPRFLPAVPRPWKEMANRVGCTSFLLRYVEAEDRKLALQQMWRVACDGQPLVQPGSRPRVEVSIGSHWPTVPMHFDVCVVLRALFKISLNLIAATCTRTPVDHRTFGHVTRLVLGKMNPSRWQLSNNGFVPPAMMSALHSTGGEHVFRLVNDGSVWHAYHSYFGGAVCAFVLIPGPSRENWRSLELVAPLRQRKWAERYRSEVIRPIPISTLWGTVEHVIPSVPVRPRFMTFEVKHTRKTTSPPRV